MSGPGDDPDRRTQAENAPAGEADETGAVRERYARRAGIAADRYSLADPAALAAMQERQRAMLRLFARVGLADFASLRLLEVGSGGGDNLLEFLRIGFRPEHLEGIELLEARHAHARSRLPEAVRLTCGDAAGCLERRAAEHRARGYDIVFQSTVFSSLLDDAFQQRLAAAMWRAVAPGGGVLWYDFTVDNPRNRDVRGVPMRRVRTLFPEADPRACRVTLAPPIARRVVRAHPGLYPLLGSVPFLRTHVLAWLGRRPAARAS